LFSFSKVFLRGLETNTVKVLLFQLKKRMTEEKKEKKRGCFLFPVFKKKQKNSFFFEEVPNYSIVSLVNVLDFTLNNKLGLNYLLKMI